MQMLAGRQPQALYIKRTSKGHRTRIAPAVQRRACRYTVAFSRSACASRLATCSSLYATLSCKCGGAVSVCGELTYWTPAAGLPHGHCGTQTRSPGVGH